MHDQDAGRSLTIPLTCSPPRLPASTRMMRLADRIQPTGNWQWLYFAAVAVAISVAPSLPLRAGLLVDAAAMFAGSGWCLVNLWRCREAHCLVTGVGWAALLVLVVVELAMGRSVIGGTESLAFVAILVVAVAFEWAWQLRYRTNALTKRPAPDASSSG